LDNDADFVIILPDAGANDISQAELTGYFMCVRALVMIMDLRADNSFEL
jgi:hypothetical protein